MFCTPSALQILIEQTKNNPQKLLGTLQSIVMATMLIPKDMKISLLKELPDTDIYNCYGSTESTGIININYKIKKDKLNSIGIAAPGVQIKIIDNEFNDIKSSIDNFGSLAVSGDMVMKGYWKDEALTCKTIVHGWLLMNDMAYIDDDGYVFLMGRSDDVINMGGKKISPFVIEEAVKSFGGIKECCCISVDDPQKILGKVPVVFVSLSTNDKRSYDEKSLYDHLKRHLEKYALPYKILVIDEIPKNALGKMLRGELVKKFGQKV
jgi:acyl-coenzyme A synthetase/AMP-(fatty) acid ligase